MSQQKKIGRITSEAQIASEARKEEEAAAKEAAQQNSQTIADLLDGKIKTSSPLVEYLVNTLRDATTERIGVQQTLQQAQQRVAAMQARLVELKGVGGKAMEDLRNQLLNNPEVVKSSTNTNEEVSDEAVTQ